MESGAAEDADSVDNEGHTPAYWGQRAKAGQGGGH